MSSTLELWQTEWCPHSHRVRQRLTELGLSFVAHQVPVDQSARTELEAATGEKTIPVLTAGDEVISGEEAILTYLERRFTEPSGGDEHRVRAANAEQEELEAACSELAAATR